jgi:hypothetical protein
VFRQTAHGWEPLPPLATLAYGIGISDSGVAWVRTLDGLSRLDGASWHGFTASDFGTKRGYLRGRFALDGDEVWGAGADGVVHFDGKRWQCYPNSLATRQPTSIAAVHGQVWVIDQEGNLSHFEGGAWTVRKLDLPGVRGGLSTSIPKLATTANGALWLVYHGLWRYAGASWTRVAGATGEAELLGATASGWYVRNGKKTETRGGVWVRDGGDVVGIDVDGAPKVRYKPQELGLRNSASVYEVAGRPPVFVLASSQGLVWFDGSQWHGEQIPALGIVMASSVAVAPDGSVWGIGYSRGPQAFSIPRRVSDHSDPAHRCRDLYGVVVQPEVPPPAAGHSRSGPARHGHASRRSADATAVRSAHGCRRGDGSGFGRRRLLAGQEALAGCAGVAAAGVFRGGPYHHNRDGIVEKAQAAAQ